MTRITPAIAAFALGISAILAACGSGAAPTQAPSASPSGPPLSITTPEAAAARVAEVVPGLAGIGSKNPDLIGGCCFWEATPSAGGFEVVYEVGWGDCPAGCIDRHRWTYAVTTDGTVTLVTESGSPVPSGVPGYAGDTTGGILPGGSGIQGRVLAGPTCPVVTVNDPACDDRPVPGATVLVLAANGTEVARLITDAAGHYGVTLPAGPYTIEPQPVDGLFRVAEPIAVMVGGGVVSVDIEYDTGIR